MVQGHEIDKLRRVLRIGRTDIFNDHICDILHFLTVIPQLVEQLHILLRKRSFHTVDHVIGVVATFTSDIHCSKSGYRHIGSLCILSINGHEARHVFSGRV